MLSLLYVRMCYDPGSSFQVCFLLFFLLQQAQYFIAGMAQTQNRITPKHHRLLFDSH